jgi:nitrogen-specific signal transduction histidine kinase
MFRSLRSTLILPWLLIAVVCCALTCRLRRPFELGIGGEIGKVDQSVKLSAERIKQQLDLYLNGFREAQKEETARFDSAGEVLLIHAIPVRSDLVIRTMGRAHVTAAAAFQKLKEKIFEPFVSSRSEGSGLGLAIAREIAEAHGGTVRCVNGRKGARFEIRLPRRQA